MKKSLLFLFLLVLGVTQGWALVYETLPTGSATLKENAVYRVESNTTINGTLSVPTDGTVTIYIAKGKTLLVRGENASTGNSATNRRDIPGKPAIEVPSTSTLIITGGGTLRVYGGKAASRYRNTTTTGSAGAAPAIGGIGGNGGADRGEGNVGADMGTVYVRGNVTVRAARGTSYGKRATTSCGADGGVPTYAIGGGGGGGAGRKGTGANGATGANGNLYIEKSARVLYLNGKRRLSDDKNFKTPTTLKVQYYVDGTLKTTQELKEFGTLNVKNETYSVTTESENVNDDGFTTVTVKKVKHWVDTNNNVYNPKDLVVYNGHKKDDKTEIDIKGISVTLRLNAVWDENSGVQFYGIHDAYELTQFANVVNAGKEDANGILMADINMAESAWKSTNVARDGKTSWGNWNNWVPIGAINMVYSADTTKTFTGIFEGNGYVVSNLTMAVPNKTPGKYYGPNVTDGTAKYRVRKGDTETKVTANWHIAYDRAGLIGYAKGATIRNVVVKDVILWAKWQCGAVCGRLDYDKDSKKGLIENCGSYGNLSFNVVELQDAQGMEKWAGNARVLAGVVTTDYSGGTNTNPNPPYVSSVWSTYNGYNNTEPATGNLWIPRKNYVVATWNGTRNPYWSDYTQNSATQNAARPKKTWIYVANPIIDNGVEKSNPILSNGELCYALNGNVQGGTAWTQTFNEEQDKNDATRDYDECPRPTSEGLAVYKDAEKVYSNHIYTVSFDANGGKENPADIYVTRVYGAANRTLSSESFPGAPALEEGEIYIFDGWWTDPDVGTEVESLSVETINSDMTLYAHWLAGPESISVKAVEDAKNPGNYYSTFYYGEQDYQIETDNVVAYKAYREMDADGKLGNGLIMMTLKDQQQHISKVIPAGEAVVLKAKAAEGGQNVYIKLNAVSPSVNDPDLDDKNILYGTDEQIYVTDVNDMITTTDENDENAYSNCYVFAFGNTNKNLGFYKPSGSTLAAHKAYALLNDQIIVPLNTGSGSAKAESLQMIFEDDEEQVTGISEHKSESETKKAIFSINGMPLSKLQKGINIVGGKKVFVK